jgi:hypothetical protein
VRYGENLKAYSFGQRPDSDAVAISEKRNGQSDCRPTEIVEKPIDAGFHCEGRVRFKPRI